MTCKQARNEIASIKSIPLDEAVAFIHEVQNMCRQRPSEADIAQVCRSLGKDRCNNAFIVALQASSLRGWTQFNVKRTSVFRADPVPNMRDNEQRHQHKSKGPPLRSHDSEWYAVEALANLHRTTHEEAERYIQAIQRMCRRRPGYDVIVEVSLYLSNEHHTMPEIAEAASVRAGLHNNVRVHLTSKEPCTATAKERCPIGTYPTNRAFTEGADDPHSDWSVAGWEVD